MAKEKVTKFVFQIRARPEGRENLWWIDVGTHNTLEEARHELQRYRAEYKDRLTKDSRILKITSEVVN